MDDYQSEYNQDNQDYQNNTHREHNQSYDQNNVREQPRKIQGGILNKDDFDHDERVVGGTSNFLDLHDKEMQKEGGGGGVIDEVQKKLDVEKPKPRKQFLKKGKRENEIKQKEEENRNKK